MATLLDDALVSDSLAALEGWSGDKDRISRTIDLPDEQAGQLRALVQESADAMDHHPQVEDGEGGTRYVLWTHDAGGVTELDITFAARINDLLNQVTGSTAHSSAPRSDAPAEVTRAGQEATEEARPSYEAPTVGVQSSRQGDSAGVPLPDEAPGEPEPGASPMQDPAER